MSFENTLWYVTFADRPQVEARIDNYDSLLIPSHLLAGGKKSVPALLKNLIEAENIEYYIDPSITEFRRGNSFRKADDSIKQWHSKLIDELGDPISDVLDTEDNLVYEVMDASERAIAVQSVCEFQENFVADAVEDSVGKYEDVGVEDVAPRAVIPWYTRIADYPHLSVNRELIELSKESTDLPLKPVLHVTKEFIRDLNARKALAELVEEVEIPETFLWVDDLKKGSTSRQEYLDVMDLVTRISGNNVDPHFMFGDYFSNLLFFFGLRGTAYGTYYREHKTEKVARGGGGGSLQRYYYDPIKEFINIADSVQLGTSNDADIPDFDEMSEWGDLFRKGTDHDFLKYHYIKTRALHKERILSNNLNSLISELDYAYNTYSGQLTDLQTVKTAEHLNTWTESLEVFIEDNSELVESLVEEARSLQS